MKKARLMIVASMAAFGTLAPFVRSISVTSGELALYRAILASLLIGTYLLLTKQPIAFDKIKKELPQKSIWAFSGYLFEKDILAGRIGDCSEYLSYLDVLVDGPFVEAKKNLSLRFRGSENQRLIDVPASLTAGEIVLWQDWQAQGKGLRK